MLFHCSFIQGEVERWIYDVKLCVSGSHFAGFDSKELPVELDAFPDVADVNGDVGFPCFYSFRCHVFLLPSATHMRLCICVKPTPLAHICQAIYNNFRNAEKEQAFRNRSSLPRSRRSHTAPPA